MSGEGCSAPGQLGSCFGSLDLGAVRAHRESTVEASVEARHTPRPGNEEGLHRLVLIPPVLLVEASRVCQIDV